ncbi:exo-beta-N-acetylmuramidase NamZ family protein [Lutibacter maritimus]
MISKPFKNTYFFLFSFVFFMLFSCKPAKPINSDVEMEKITSEKDSKGKKNIITGAQQTYIYLPSLFSKKIAIVANQTSVILKKNNQSYTHLVDSLHALDITISKVFSPEHGFRGTADASELVKDGIDTKTGIPIVSLYGNNKKPTQEQLKGIDAVIFDIQDVGVRFYTYISTLHYVMEACAEAGIPVIVLDRPNPNGHYIDGPTLQIEYKSFVGMHPVPLVYGMTIGEYATMINGENWLKTNNKCDLTVIPLKNYTHKSIYSLPIRPSPNLPNDVAINLYPSLGFFEGTTINAGRGTEFQFQRYGAPFFPENEFSYTPQPNFGSKHPKHEGKLCYGVDLENTDRLSKININWLIDAYKKIPVSETFFGATFTIHAGNTLLEDQLKTNVSAKKIRESWQHDINAFKKIRENYLLYE